MNLENAKMDQEGLSLRDKLMMQADENETVAREQFETTKGQSVKELAGQVIARDITPEDRENLIAVLTNKAFRSGDDERNVILQIREAGYAVTDEADEVEAIDRADEIVAEIFLRLQELDKGNPAHALDRRWGAYFNHLFGSIDRADRRYANHRDRKVAEGYQGVLASSIIREFVQDMGSMLPDERAQAVEYLKKEARSPHYPNYPAIAGDLLDALGEKVG